MPWLSQAENHLESLAPASFKRKDIEKQLKDLSAFRNEVWKRSGEYENNRTLGDTFVAACDIDKEVVKGELALMKQRWDRLNNGTFIYNIGFNAYNTANLYIVKIIHIPRTEHN